MTKYIGRFFIIKIFLLTCLLRGMTDMPNMAMLIDVISTHMPLARHDVALVV